MADIISGDSRFLKDENKSNVTNFRSKESDNNDNKQKRDYKKIIIIGIVIAVILIIISAIKWFGSASYSVYSVMHSINRDDSDSANYIGYQDGYIRYSNDGIEYHNKDGNAIWSKTYTMSHPQVKICEDKVAVGDINGSTIYIFDKNGAISEEIDTSVTISQIEVTATGLVAAVLEDSDSNYINMYDTSGKKIYTVKTSLSGDGYPIDIAVSNDGTKLVSSYLYVSGENMKTNVVFYNFSDVGQNETERVVGGFNHYQDTIVGDVKFVDNMTAIAIGENVLSIYKIKEYPDLKKEIKIDAEIEQVVTADKYIGLVLKNNDSGDIYKMVIYDSTGNEVSQIKFNTQYSDIQIDGKTVIMNNSNNMVVMRLNGKQIADIKYDLPIDTIIPLGKTGNYIYVNTKYIQWIKLR